MYYRITTRVGRPVQIASEGGQLDRIMLGAGAFGLLPSSFAVEVCDGDPAEADMVSLPRDESQELEALRELANCALTCEAENTAEWMELMRGLFDRVQLAQGDKRICHCDGKRFTLRPPSEER